MTRRVSDDQLYVPGENVEITVLLEKSGAGTLASLEVIESLPAGWSFAGMAGTARPDIVPTAGATGLVTFAWNRSLRFRLSFVTRQSSVMMPSIS